MLKSDFVESDKDITKFIDTKVYENALNSLAKENPDEVFWKKRLEIFAERDSAAKTAAIQQELLKTAATKMGSPEKRTELADVEIPNCCVQR